MEIYTSCLNIWLEHEPEQGDVAFVERQDLNWTQVSCMSLLPTMEMLETVGQFRFAKSCDGKRCVLTSH